MTLLTDITQGQSVTVLPCERRQLYHDAKTLGITIHTQAFTDRVIVTHNGPAGEPGINYIKEFKSWLMSLGYDEPTAIPDHLDHKPDSVIQMCLSKSGLATRYKNRTVTRLSVAVRKHNGHMVLKIRDTVVAEFTATKRCYLHINDIRLIREIVMNDHKNARRYGDQIHCAHCGKQWDVNDPEPPGCSSGELFTKNTLQPAQRDVTLTRSNRGRQR